MYNKVLSVVAALCASVVAATAITVGDSSGVYINGGAPVSGMITNDYAKGTGVANSNKVDHAIYSDDTGAYSGDTLQVGVNNAATGLHSATVGDNNIASGLSSLAVGSFNRATNTYASVFGQSSTAGGYASLAAGETVTASGADAIALGNNAVALYDNSFVWSDGTLTTSTTNQQFRVHASNGTVISGGDISFSGIRLINVGSPVDSTDAANKDYVDTFVQGLSWQDHVISFTSQPPASVSLHARYLVKSVGTGVFTNHDNAIAIVTNVALTTNWSFTSPEDGWTVVSIADAQAFVYNSTLTNWVQLTSAGIVQWGTIAGTLSNQTDLWSYVTWLGANTNSMQVPTGTFTRLVVLNQTIAVSNAENTVILNTANSLQSTTNSNSYATLVGHDVSYNAGGTENSAFGYRALISSAGSYNSCFGGYAGGYSAGNDNAAFGDYAGYYCAGDYNTYLGYQAGFRSGGRSNIIIGANAGMQSPDSGITDIYTNMIILGANIKPKGSGTIAIGSPTHTTYIDGALVVSNGISGNGSGITNISGSNVTGLNTSNWNSAYNSGAFGSNGVMTLNGLTSGWNSAVANALFASNGVITLNSLTSGWNSAYNWVVANSNNVTAPTGTFLQATITNCVATTATVATLLSPLATFTNMNVSTGTFLQCTITNYNATTGSVNQLNTTNLTVNGKIGLGTSSPSNSIQIGGFTGIGGTSFEGGAAGGYFGFNVYNNGGYTNSIATGNRSGYIAFNNSGIQLKTSSDTQVANTPISNMINAITIDTSGFVGFSTNAMSHLITVKGGAYCDGTGDWIAGSDIRWKKNIIPAPTNMLGLAAVLQMNPVTYIHVADTNNLVQIGFVAQDLKAIAPYAVMGDTNNPDEYMGIAYARLVPYLVNAIKELQEEIRPVGRKNTLAQKQYENDYFLIVKSVLTLANDPRKDEVPIPKLSLDELDAILDVLYETPATEKKANKLAIKLLSVNSALIRYDINWWDTATYHEGI